MDYSSYLGFILPSVSKGQPGGVATLDGSGKIPSEQLPSYVDDIIEYDEIDDFPIIGEQGKIYIDKQTGFSYRWTGSQYVRVPSCDITDVEVDGVSVVSNGVAEIDLSGKVSSSSVSNIWTGTQVEYDAIVTKDSSTLYFIKES